MVEEGADLVRDARGNVAAREGVLGSAELSITDPNVLDVKPLPIAQEGYEPEDQNS